MQFNLFRAPGFSSEVFCMFQLEMLSRHIMDQYIIICQASIAERWCICLGFLSSGSEQPSNPRIHIFWKEILNLVQLVQEQFQVARGSLQKGFISEHLVDAKQEHSIICKRERDVSCSGGMYRKLVGRSGHQNDMCTMRLDDVHVEQRWHLSKPLLVCHQDF